MNSVGDGPPARLPPPPFWRTPYFEIARRRPDRALLTDDATLAVLANPARVVLQPDGRVRHWVSVPALGRWLRVVMLEDGGTVHNAFLDRSFVP
ncbi:MAG: hypothetical protein WAS21_21105 [Geminicoccaceae bacterium]